MPASRVGRLEPVRGYPACADVTASGWPPGPGPGEREPNPGAPTTGDVTVKNVDATSLWISWGAGSCTDAHRLTIDPSGRSISISQPPFCGGDTVGVGRKLVLTFGGPIAAPDVAATDGDTHTQTPQPTETDEHDGSPRLNAATASSPRAVPRRP